MRPESEEASSTSFEQQLIITTSNAPRSGPVARKRPESKTATEYTFGMGTARAGEGTPIRESASTLQTKKILLRPVELGESEEEIRAS